MEDRHHRARLLGHSVRAKPQFMNYYDRSQASKERRNRLTAAAVRGELYAGLDSPSTPAEGPSKRARYGEADAEADRTAAAAEGGTGPEGRPSTSTGYRPRVPERREDGAAAAGVPWRNPQTRTSGWWSGQRWSGSWGGRHWGTWDWHQWARANVIEFSILETPSAIRLDCKTFRKNRVRVMSHQGATHSSSRSIPMDVHLLVTQA